MNTLLALLRYYLVASSLMAWLAGVGAVLVLAGSLIPGKLGAALMMVGSVLAVLGPVMAGGFEFRRLLASSRIALLPGARPQAVLALAVLAALASLVLWLGVLRLPQVEPLRLLPLFFVGISAWLLATQWLASFRAGMLVLPVSIMMFPQARQAFPEAALPGLATAWALALATVLAWLLLWRGTGRLGRARALKLLPPQGNSEERQRAAPPAWLRGQTVSKGADFLLLGGSDGLWARLRVHATLVFGFPLAFGLMMALLNPASSVTSEIQEDPQLLLVATGYGMLSMGMLSHDWPARMRMLWLRLGGERAALYPRLERALLRDAALNAACGLGVAVAVWGLTPLPGAQALAYLAIWTVTALWMVYGNLWLRLKGLHWFVHTLFALGTLAILGTAIGRVVWADEPLSLTLVLAAQAASTVWLRGDARRRFARIDWCRMRPLQLGSMGRRAARG